MPYLKESTNLEELIEEHEKLLGSGNFKRGDNGEHTFDRLVSKYCLVESSDKYLDIMYQYKGDSKYYTNEEMKSLLSVLKK